MYLKKQTKISGNNTILYPTPASLYDVMGGQNCMHLMAQQQPEEQLIRRASAAKV